MSTKGNNSKMIFRPKTHPGKLLFRNLGKLHPRLKMMSITNVDIKAEKVLKQLKSLNTSNSCGPDECHPYFLKECVNKMYLSLTDIFRKSVALGEVPDNWRKANITCIFQERNQTGSRKPTSVLDSSDMYIVGE